MNNFEEMKLYKVILIKIADGRNRLIISAYVKAGKINFCYKSLGDICSKTENERRWIGKTNNQSFHIVHL